jgi:hypothetical protein
MAPTTEAPPERIYILQHRDRSGLRARLSEQATPAPRPMEIDVELRAAMLERERQDRHGRGGQFWSGAARSHARLPGGSQISGSSALDTLVLTGRSLHLR